MSDEYWRRMRLAKMRLANTLSESLAEVRAQIRAIDAELRPPVADAYRIALRPDVDGEDPYSPDTLMDDIVVRDVKMFRAEQMDTHEWWVCCYLDDESSDRICWWVTAKARPRRIEWVTTEFPNAGHVYEHELERAAVRPEGEQP
jgi:hypothetical protein